MKDRDLGGLGKGEGSKSKDKECCYEDIINVMRGNLGVPCFASNEP